MKEGACPHAGKALAAALLALAGFAAALPAGAQGPSVEELVARAKKRDADAEYTLAMMAYEGRGVPRDPNQALRLMERAARRGNLDAQNALGFFLQHGIGGPANAARARGWYESAAERGHAQAQVNYGWMFQEGLGGPRDAVIALLWYRKAAGQGSAEGEFNAASLLERGAEGVAADAEAAAEGYARAAKFGLPLASYRLARMLDEGRAARRSDGTAFERYLAAAQDGIAEAQAELDKPATQYRFALQLAPVAAVPWLRRAAAQNHLPAQLALAIALEEGRGTAANPAEAFQWYLKAAAADDPEAHFRLGNLYDQGSGTPVDAVRSRDHYAKAAALGHAAAEQRMARLVGVGAPDFNNPFKGLR